MPAWRHAEPLPARLANDDPLRQSLAMNEEIERIHKLAATGPEKAEAEFQRFSIRSNRK